MLETVLSGSEMQKLDAQAIAAGVPGLILMENAARGAVDVLLEELGRPQNVWIVCGKGNNGGDGLAMGRHLRNRGIPVEVLVLAEPEGLTGDAAQNLHMARATGVPLTFTPEPAEAVSWLSRRAPAVLVDAILGTGLKTAARGLPAAAIETIRGRPQIPVLAVDLPSGLSADTGLVPGPTLHARVTATFCRPKVAHHVYPAAGYCGRIRVVEISIPRALVDAATAACKIGAPPTDWLSPRSADTHKGTYGRLLVVAGSSGMTGAAALAALAAVRGGAGLVTVATASKAQPVLAAKLLEAMSLSLPEAPDGGLDLAGAELVLGRLGDGSALLLGPGLGQAPSTVAFVRHVVQRAAVPLVLDADGLNALGREAAGLLASRPGPAILTPHPGEMARLLGRKPADRLEEARAFAAASRSVLVLKGAGTVVSDGTESYVNSTGNPGMATGGSGDVLGGLIGALAAQGLDPWRAAVLGAHLHGLAGDLAAQSLGQEALAASDLIHALPQAWRRWHGPAEGG